MEEEEAIHAQIIRESSKLLLVIKMLSNFFNHKNLYAVYVRTTVIHNLFESNKNLDINKLDLFHVQYTSSLIDLFQKLKKAKEQQYLLVNDEMYINDDLVKKLEKEAEASNFTGASKMHGQLMAAKLKQLYAMLAENTVASFSWGDITTFSTRMANEFYREVTDEQFLRLTAAQDKKTYQNNYITIERKLLGKLNIVNFRIKFGCGLLYNNETAEVYNFIDSNESFIFISSTKSFYLLSDEAVKGIDLSKNLSNKAGIIRDLKYKNDQLHDKLGTIKTSLPNNVEEVLEGYLAKISGVDFLEELQNVDEQTNILRAMLNININSK